MVVEDTAHETVLNGFVSTFNYLYKILAIAYIVKWVLTTTYVINSCPNSFDQ